MCLIIACMLCGCQKEQEADSTSQTGVVSETGDDIAAENVTENVTEAASETETASETEEAPTENEQVVEDMIPEEYAAALVITINPKIKLYVDSDNVVIGVEYLNEDAKAVAAGIELANHPVEETVEKLIVAATEQEFLTDGKNVDVDVAEIKDEEYDSKSVCETVEAVVEEVAQEYEMEVTVAKSVESEPIVEEPENPCSNCNGTGKCDECLGDGYLGVGYSVSCPRCHGTLTETCIYCDESGNSNKHEGKCDFPNCMGSHVYSCTTCGGGTTPVTCDSCKGDGKCKVCGGTGIAEES